MTLDFDIDVDLAPLLGQIAAPALIDDQWYLAAYANRRPGVHAQAKRLLRKALLQAQWQAACARPPDRRRAIRAPLLSRVHTDIGARFVASDVSLSGLRCSGEPTDGELDIEFRLPGLEFPVEARAEVVSMQSGLAAASLGLRFKTIERPYLEWIAHYIDTQRRLVGPVGAGFTPARGNARAGGDKPRPYRGFQSAS